MLFWGILDLVKQGADKEPLGREEDEEGQGVRRGGRSEEQEGKESREEEKRKERVKRGGRGGECTRSSGGLRGGGVTRRSSHSLDPGPLGRHRGVTISRLGR